MSDVRGHEAGPDGVMGGVLLLHAWWGLVPDIRAFADRLATDGWAVVAPDLFEGRTAATVEEAEPLAGGADEATVNGLADAALARLKERLAPGARIVAVAFSFGAHWAVRATAMDDAVAGAVLYYGTTGGPILAEARGTILGHFAADDPFEAAEWVDEFAGHLRDAGCDVTLHRYEGAGHWFAEPSRDAYRAEAAAIAFDRTRTFLREQLGPLRG